MWYVLGTIALLSAGNVGLKVYRAFHSDTDLDDIGPMILAALPPLAVLGNTAVVAIAYAVLG